MGGMVLEKLYIVIPAYNEEANIEKVVRQWHQVACQTGPEARLVVVNDGSRDGTAQKLEALARELPALIPLTKPNGGHGAACLFGYRYALEQGADYIFQTDSDGQTLPEEFAPFWEQRAGYDLVIGRRVHRGDGFSRWVVTKVLKYVTLFFLRAYTADPNTPYRLMKREFLARCLELIPENFFLPNVLIAAFAARMDLPVLSLPVSFLPRQGGVNSLNLARIFRIGLKAVGDFRRVDRTLRRQGL